MLLFVQHKCIQDDFGLPKGVKHSIVFHHRRVCNNVMLAVVQYCLYVGNVWHCVLRVQEIFKVTSNVLKFTEIWHSFKSLFSSMRLSSEFFMLILAVLGAWFQSWLWRWAKVDRIKVKIRTIMLAELYLLMHAGGSERNQSILQEGRRVRLPLTRKPFLG